MKTDEETRIEELDFIEKNIAGLASLAAGHFIDPMVRPKKKRVKFTEKSYTEFVLEGVEYWKTADINAYMRSIHGIKELASNALDNQFRLWLQVYNLLNQRVDEELIAEDAAKKKRLRDLRVTQQDMDVFDANRRCLACGKFMFLSDEKNNTRHEKQEICTCNSSRGLQNQMKARISEYRSDLADKKKLPKKDPMRYKK